jgi:hypothetical protein
VGLQETRTYIKGVYQEQNDSEQLQKRERRYSSETPESSAAELLHTANVFSYEETTLCALY